jgi:hypothetical protein
MFDTGCCGANLKQNIISKWGVFSMAVPLFYLSLLFFLILWPIGLIIRSFNENSEWLRRLVKANWNVIQRVQFLSKLKCQVSGTLYKLYPKLSGQFFKSFNLLFFSFLWVSLIAFFRIGVEVLG